LKLSKHLLISSFLCLSTSSKMNRLSPQLITLSESAGTLTKNNIILRNNLPSTRLLLQHKLTSTTSGSSNNQQLYKKYILSRKIAQLGRWEIHRRESDDKNALCRDDLLLTLFPPSPPQPTLKLYKLNLSTLKNKSSI
jgi:hypothetical protein